MFNCQYPLFSKSVPPCPVNLNTLADKIKAGENASSVLTTELPVFKATPGNQPSLITPSCNTCTCTCIVVITCSW